MLLFRSIMFDVLYWVVMVVMGILCVPLAIASPRGATWSVQNFNRIGLWMLRVICGLRVEVRGEVPQGDVLVASKHQSFLDILIHVTTLPRPRFIMKDELKWVPILGVYTLRMGSTPVVRGKKGAAVKKMVDSAEKNSREPGQLVIYPQGTRLAPGVVAPYKVGAAVLYERMGVTCVPAATNAGVFWGRKSAIRKPGVAVVEYLEPIPAGLPTQEFLSILEERIEAASNGLLAEAKAG